MMPSGGDKNTTMMIKSVVLMIIDGDADEWVTMMDVTIKTKSVQC